MSLINSKLLAVKLTKATTIALYTVAASIQEGGEEGSETAVKGMFLLFIIELLYI